MSAELVIGPVLRRVVGTRATVWVETSAPATVRVSAGEAAGEATTFSVYGHHYAIVVVEGLTPGGATPYEVFVDDARVWPEPGSPYPPSVIRTREGDDTDQPVRLVFGSCRETTQHATPRKLPPDALDAYARRLMSGAVPAPDLLVLLGDQVYADIPSPAVKRLLSKARHSEHDHPEDEVVTYEEYTQLYLESWRDPEIRWLFATVPSAMIFDDHEIIDDWNSSASWRREVREQPWWPERISSGLASYWVYQHLGNLDPDQIAADPVYQKVMAAADDATDVLREFGTAVDSPPSPVRRLAGSPNDEQGPERHEADGAPGYQWSYALDLGRTRLVVLDNRCSRVLDPGHRAMLPPGEWAWFAGLARGDFDHLVVGSSLPWLLPPGIHHMEAWNERLAGSARPRVAAFAERQRRAFDLEHWASMQGSFDALAGLFAEVGSAGVASISVLSGDVHHSYVARALYRDRPVAAPVHQLTCSPVHNQIQSFMRPVLRLGWWRGPTAVARTLARAARVAAPAVRWRKLAGPYFGNAVSTLVHEGRSARVLIEGTTTGGDLREVAAVELTARAPSGAASSG
ncbi:alkaline phosphatase D family protein [Phytohabitans sp. ZYX-F-186]|uniref:Alkaline phosphatase D family protein n=1 Tax=Phytohabitans maris TaxID=3071409 RepID=A0ABU0ZV42_9ACTN|nr:alkaline phosphatase D family protein [Phytohabitans sp. ZYX-F-186]MDQ7910906.1 alkaline phosphatase D family protein [Phytohabitans sp. ZYX-F-186]